MVRHYVALHNNLVAKTEKNIVHFVYSQEASLSNSARDNLMLNSATHLMIASYRYTQFFILSINSCNSAVFSIIIEIGSMGLVTGG